MRANPERRSTGVEADDRDLVVLAAVSFHRCLESLPDGATPQDAAAWTVVARVLLNLDETISKN